MPAKTKRARQAGWSDAIARPKPETAMAGVGARVPRSLMVGMRRLALELSERRGAHITVAALVAEAFQDLLTKYSKQAK